MTEYVLVKIDTGDADTLRNLRSFIGNSYATIRSHMSEDIKETIQPMIDRLVDEEFESADEKEQDNDDSKAMDDLSTDNDGAAAPEVNYAEVPVWTDEVAGFDEGEAMERYDSIGGESGFYKLVKEPFSKHLTYDLESYDNTRTDYCGMILDAFRVVSKVDTGPDDSCSLIATSDIMINQLNLIKELATDEYKRINMKRNIQNLGYKPSEAYFDMIDNIEKPKERDGIIYFNENKVMNSLINIGAGNIDRTMSELLESFCNPRMVYFHESMRSFHVSKIDSTYKRHKAMYYINKSTLRIPYNSPDIDEFKGITGKTKYDYVTVENHTKYIGYGELAWAPTYEKCVPDPTSNIDVPNIKYFFSYPLFVVLMLLITYAVGILDYHGHEGISKRLMFASDLMRTSKRPISGLAKYLFLLFYVTYQYNILDTFFHLGFSLHDLRNSMGFEHCLTPISYTIHEYTGNMYTANFMAKGRFKSRFRNMMIELGLGTHFFEYLKLSNVNHIGGTKDLSLMANLDLSDILDNASLIRTFIKYREADHRKSVHNDSDTRDEHYSMQVSVHPQISASAVSGLYKKIIYDRIKYLGRKMSEYKNSSIIS